MSLPGNRIPFYMIAVRQAPLNNKLVRLRGHFSGNFEYSMLSGDGCQGSLWFGYGGDGGPPTLAIHIGGEARPGSEDSDGKLILPVPVKVVRDAKLDLFEKQTILMANADTDSAKTNSNEFVSHCVTATFIGRIDGVSREVHEFRKERKTQDHKFDTKWKGPYYIHDILWNGAYRLRDIETDDVLPKTINRDCLKKYLEYKALEPVIIIEST